MHAYFPSYVYDPRYPVFDFSSRLLLEMRSCPDPLDRYIINRSPFLGGPATVSFDNNCTSLWAREIKGERVHSLRRPTLKWGGISSSDGLRDVAAPLSSFMYHKISNDHLGIWSCLDNLVRECSGRTHALWLTMSSGFGIVGDSVRLMVTY